MHWPAGCIGICLHLTTIHQVVGCQPHPLNHAHSHGIQLSCQNVRGTQAGLRAPIRKIIAWHLLALNHNRILLLPFNLCSVHHRRYGIQKFLGRWNILLIVRDEIVEISAKEIMQRISLNLLSLSRKKLIKNPKLLPGYFEFHQLFSLWSILQM